MLIREKVEQATEILRESQVDCWITFVRESSMTGDPSLDFLVASDLTWHSALIITRQGSTHAIVGQLDKAAIEDLGVYQEIVGYVEGIRKPLQDVLQKVNPSSIAVNYSQDSEVADGLTHGMYLTLHDILSEIGLGEKIISSAKVVSSLRARKTAVEIDSIKRAIEHTLEIFTQVQPFIKAGRSEKEIAAFMASEVEKRKLGFAWDPTSCPAVFTGPDTAGAHYQPTSRKVENGHVLNMDFGVRYEGYCSDLQRTFYVLEDGETVAPKEVQRGFKTITTSIELSRKALKPGVLGWEVDAIARNHLLSEGYDEFPHGLGHQVGRFAHDGTALLGPTWEKYAGKPYEPIEAGMVFTLEPRLKVPGRGIVTIEEMVVVTESGAQYLSSPQTELLLIE
ncbi:MAG TPA: Xaa-Pro peptidase family protein [Acidobacteriota bacterium]|nr:Xaa-Pro peptidase family protein [Acidobacteriota bacterium]